MKRRELWSCSTCKTKLQKWSKDIHLVTGISMKNKLLSLIDKVILRGRGIVETINDQLKNQEQIEHTGHRSLANFSANVLAGLITYQLQPKMPSLNFMNAVS
jgi:hypothetical protein